MGRLAHPPIHEAVIDLRIGSRDDQNGLLTNLRSLAESFAADYPRVQTLKTFEGRIHFEEAGPSFEAGSGTLIGFMIRSEDERRFAQLRTTGLTVGHLKPYSSWDALFSDAWEVWTSYENTVSPQSVTRIATRFVNRLELPLRFNTEEYFTIPISVPDGLPDNLNAFEYSYVLDAGDGLLAKVRLATERPSGQSAKSLVILDSDCFVPSVRPADDPAIRDDFGRLRELKNKIFFRTLTEKAVDLYK